MLTPLVGTLTHFCNPARVGLGLFREPNGRVESYLAVVSAGLNTFCERAEMAHANSYSVQSKIIFIINFLVIHHEGNWQ